MKIKFWIFILSCLFSSQSQADALLTYWNFNNASSTFSSPNLGSLSTTAATFGERYDSTTYKLYSNTANSTVFNSNSIYMDFSDLVAQGGTNNGGTSSSVSWGLYSSTTANRASTDSTTGGSLLVIGAAYSSHGIVFSLSSLGYQSLNVSYDERTTNSSLSQTWYYSLDGSTWTSIQTFGYTTSTWITQTFSLNSSLNDQNTFYLKLIYSGSGGSSSIDNFQLTGIAIPETSTCIFLGIGGFILIAVSLRPKQIIIS